MNHSVNKWQQNKQGCIQGPLSGTEWCDSWNLLSYRYSLYLVGLFTLSLPPSLALSTPSRSIAHREWVTWNELSPTDRHCFLQPDRGSVLCLILQKGSGWFSIDYYSHTVTSFRVIGIFVSCSSKKLMGDYFLSQC